MPTNVITPDTKIVKLYPRGPMGPAGSGGGGGGGGGSYQPLDADLTAIAALNSSTAGTIASTGSGWIHRTWAQVKTLLVLTKSDVGLSNVDNTSDASKPVSTATQTALDAKQAADADLTAIAALNSATAGVVASEGAGWVQRTFPQLKTLMAFVKADVGLSNVDNTTDLAKPVSTATQSALDLKADVTALDDYIPHVGGLIPTSYLPAVTIGESTSVGSQAAMLALTAQIGDVAIRTDQSNTKYLLLGTDPTVLANWVSMAASGGAVDSVNGQTGVVVLAKGDVGLGNVDNTTDLNKPISTATQTALDAKQPLDSDLTTFAALNSATSGVPASDGSGWIHKTYAQLKTALSLVKGDVGLGNVDNTSDANKPVSTAQAAADALKVDKALYDANSILYATTDDTPAALTVGASTFVGRKASGGIAAMTVAEVLTLLGLTTEDLQDLVGAMVNGGTETGLTVTYDDTNGRYDFVVDDTTKVAKTLFDANTILYATTDNTPVALTVGASTFVGRKASGDISAMSVSEVQTLITATNGKGFVNHGSTAGTARPSGFASIEWLGTVEPTNAVNGDTWINA